ncbi:hypothetical protein QR680_013313 [Steinernema hermaphroditum]|uniref:SOCS box domain-containing protein n=1 Tax=Steinernema hermaphroditum TaxID=289476 RepID=A0AA39I6M7_9BILA|nr:hypothetical protein QR680_013313 [Steinernema hermaphroditum]
MPAQPRVSANFRLDLETEPLTRVDQKELQRQLADKIRDFASVDDIRMLLVCGANADTEITLGLTPLHYACHSDYFDAAKLLLVRGANVDSINAGGYSPMHMCAERGNYRLIKLLLDYSARVCYVTETEEQYPIRDSVDEPLRMAIRRGHFGCARLLLENGADPNARYFDGPEICHVPPTETQFLSLMLNFGANPNVHDRDGLTPLMKACRAKEQGFKALRILLDHGADINALAKPKQDLKTALHYAVLSGSLDLVCFLIENGANVNMSRDYDKASPLDLAVLTDNPHMVATLLEAGADVDTVHSLVGSPLHFACSTAPLINRVQIIELLLRCGANPNLSKTYDNGTTLKSPLVEYFRQRDNADPRVVKLFFSYGGRFLMRSPAQDPRGQLRNLIRLFVSQPGLLELIVDLGEQFDRTAVERLPVPESIKERLMQRTSNPGSLKQLARLSLRSLLTPFGPEAVDSLPLPRILKSYLLGLIASQ